MKSYFSLLLLLSTAIVFSQDISVLDKNTNQVIAGVALYNLSKTTSTITNLDGVASIDSFANDEVIYFRHISYQKFKIDKNEIIKNQNIVLLQPNTQNLDEILVSASKFNQNKKEIPQKIIRVNSKSIQFSNPQTSADLLEESGNVYIQKSQLGGGSPMIRGFSTNRLLISVDDVRMNNAIFRGGNLQNVISIDPFSIQNTEITLGSGSVIYGSDAIGGVMSFYTQKPQLSFKDSLDFSANSIIRYASANNEKTAHIDFNLGLKKWAFLTNASFTDFENLHMGKHGPEDYLRIEYVQTVNGEDSIVQNSNPLIQKPTGYNQFNILEKIKYQPQENLYFNLGLYYSQTSDYSRYDRLLRYKDENLRSAEWYYGPQKWFMTNFKITKLSSRSSLYDKLKVTTAYQNFKESRFDRDYQSRIKNIRKESVDAYSFNLDLEKELSKKTEFNYGLEYLYNSVFSKAKELNILTNTEISTVSRYPNGSNWQSMAAYSSLKYKPNPKFVLQTGLRYNHIIAHADFTENNQYLNLPFNKSEVNTGALTGTAGITWTPNNTIQWRLNASTAFRAPNIDDIGKVFDSEPGSVVVPTQNLKSEYAYGGDLGLKLNFNGVVKLDLGTYYTYLDNALVRRDYMLNGESQIMYDGELSNVQAIQNASKAWIYGFETGLEINFTNAFKLKSQYNFIGGTEENEDIEVPIRHVAPSFGNTHLEYKKDKFTIDAFINYNGELSYNQLAPSEIEKDYIYALDENSNPYSPSWYTLNLRAQFQIIKSIQFTSSLENITNQRYKTYSSGLVASGINFIATLKYSL